MGYEHKNMLAGHTHTEQAFEGVPVNISTVTSLLRKWSINQNTWLQTGRERRDMAGRGVAAGTEGVAENLTSHFQVPATSEQ